MYVPLTIQGVVTPLCATLLMAVTGLGDPVEMGMALYTTEKSQSHHGFLPKSQYHCRILLMSQGHGGYSSEVTRSQPNFRQPQILTSVAAVSIAHNIGVTSPCYTCRVAVFSVNCIP